jgi:hypothetical protein
LSAWELQHPPQCEKSEKRKIRFANSSPNQCMKNGQTQAKIVLNLQSNHLSIIDIARAIKRNILIRRILMVFGNRIHHRRNHAKNDRTVTKYNIVALSRIVLHPRGPPTTFRNHEKFTISPGTNNKKHP